MHLRTTFFLLVLTVLIFSFVCFYEGPNGGGPEKTMATPRLLSLEPERVNYWSFVGEKGLLECVSEHGQWMISKPFRTRARDEKINHMLSVLASLPKGETITADQRRARGLSLADYGLEKPQFRVVIGVPEKRVVINVGNVSPLKDSVYVQMDGSDVVLAIATNLLQIIPRDLADIRDHHLLSGGPSFVKKIEIKSRNGPLMAAFKEGAEWILRKPVMARADWLKMTALLDTLFNAKATEFVSDAVTDPAVYGLDDSEASLKIGVWQNGDAEHIVFGRRVAEQTNAVYACVRGQGSVFTVPDEVVRALDITVGGIRDSRIFFMAPKDITLIRIEEGAKILQLARTVDNQWQIVEPKQWQANARAVENLIASLNSLRIEMFTPSANVSVPSTDRPGKIIVVSSRPLGETLPGKSLMAQERDERRAVPEKVERVLTISAPAVGQEYVIGKFADEDELYQLSVSAVAAISVNPMMYRDNTVLELDPAAVRKIAVRKAGREQSVSRGESGWSGTAETGGRVDQQAIEALLARAALLRAVRFEQSEGMAASIYGLEPVSRSITFSLSGAEGISKTLIFGQDTDDNGVYAMLQGQETVFVLDRELVNVLLQDLIR